MSVCPRADDQNGYALTPAQQKAVAFLSAGAAVAVAARAVGVHRNTVTNWRRQPAFQAALLEARQSNENLWCAEADAIVLLKAALSLLERQVQAAATRPGATMPALPTSARSTPPPEMRETKPSPPVGAISTRSSFVHPNDQPAQIHARQPVSPGRIVQPAHNPAHGQQMHQTNPFRDSTRSQPPNNSQPPAAARVPKIGRNQPCPCGSGKKFKRCCLSHPAC